MQDAGHLGASDDERSELERLSQARHEFVGRGLEPRVEGFVAWPGPRADAALHVFLAGAVALGCGGRPALGLVGLLLVLASSIGQRRGLVLLRHLLPRRRSYNVVARVGSGRRVVAVAFLDRPGSPTFAKWTRRVLLAGAGVVGAILLAIWSGWDLEMLETARVVVGAGLAGLGGGLLVHGLRERGLVDTESLQRLCALADQPPEGVELWLVASGTGWPGLDGLRALEEQHRHEWGSGTRWLVLGGGQQARAWLARRRLPALDGEDAFALIDREYDGDDAPAAAERELVRDPVREGDGP